jgi:hypothetical protein
MRHCTNHCRGCDRHFTSLEGFDAHKPHWPGRKGRESCGEPEDAGLVELIGSCEISDPDSPKTAISLWVTPRHFKGVAVERAVKTPEKAYSGTQT